MLTAATPGGEGSWRQAPYPREELPERGTRLAWRKGLEELDPAARAAIAAVAAEKERPTDLDIDRMVAGLGANAETNAETDAEAT